MPFFFMLGNEGKFQLFTKPIASGVKELVAVIAICKEANLCPDGRNITCHTKLSKIILMYSSDFTACIHNLF